MSGNEAQLIITVVAMSVGAMIAVVALISTAITKMRNTRQVEESRRELAAYVAEGSMSADDAYRLLSAQAGAPNKSGS